MRDVKKAMDFIEHKLKMGKVSYLSEDETYILFSNEMMNIKAHKEIEQDRHKVEIKEKGTDEDYGFYCTLPVYMTI